jgi:hypothetical protein
MYYVQPSSDCGGYLYRSLGGRLELVRDEVGLSLVVQRELSTAEAVRSFIHKRLIWAYVQCLASSDIMIIDSNFVNVYKDSHFDYLPKTSIVGTWHQQVALLNEYASRKALSVYSDRWSFTIYVMTPKGSVEEWNVNGMLSPFTIQPLQKRTVQADEAFSPVIWR